MTNTDLPNAEARPSPPQRREKAVTLDGTADIAAPSDCDGGGAKRIERPAPSPASSSTRHNVRKKSKKRRLPKDADIAIIGTGMGGLSAAIALRNAGFTNVTVYERDGSFGERRDGYGLTLTYNPKGPLAKLGLLETVARMDCPSRSHYVFKPDGTILGYYGNAFHDLASPSAKRRGLGQRGNLRVPRQVLRGLMIDELLNGGGANDEDGGAGTDGPTKTGSQTIQIKWGKRLVSFEDRAADGSSSIFRSDGGEGDVVLRFDDGTVERVDFLVGADGIRSAVTRTLLVDRDSADGNSSDSGKANRCRPAEGKSCEGGLAYLGVIVILGITDNFHHPLLDERGFYTLDGTNRLFTMPYEGSKIDDDLNTKRRRIMWQLSYRQEDEQEARKLSQSGPGALLQEVEKRCQSWHEPVLGMIRATPLASIWGTGLMDRDPDQFLCIDNYRGHKQSRVVVLGDAVHAMSCFKGQGANQALTDGPLLASWLQKSAVDSAVRGFMREMVTRTGEKVKASRDAASFLHSSLVMEEKQDFAGVRGDAVPNLLDFLRQKQIGASKGGRLDEIVREILVENRTEFLPFATGDGRSDCKDLELLERRALDYAVAGDTAGLRKLSSEHPGAIHSALDEEKRSCLHLSASGGHYHACRFLLSETFAPHTILDASGNSPLHAACVGGHPHVVVLLSAKSKGCDACWAPNNDGMTPSLIVSRYQDEALKDELVTALAD